MPWPCPRASPRTPGAGAGAQRAKVGEGPEALVDPKGTPEGSTHCGTHGCCQTFAISSLREPRASIKFNNFPEGLRELCKATVLMVTVYYRERTYIKVKGRGSWGRVQAGSTHRASSCLPPVEAWTELNLPKNEVMY